MGLSAQQEKEIELKYTAYKTFYCHDLPVAYDANALTEEDVAQVESRINLLRQVARQNNATGQYIDASIITHLVGELQTSLLVGKQLAWNKLSPSEKNYQRMKLEHPEWRVKSNILLDMTGPIVDESMSLDVAIFQSLVLGWLLNSVIPTKPGVATPPKKPIISKIAAFTGSNDQFRTYVLRKLMSEPNNPLRFLLNKAGNGWNTASRSHDVLIERYDVWEAGHIGSKKIGGVRLMIQSAWENQVQNTSIEHPSKGGAAVLDSPAVEVGGLPVAKSTVKTWELAGVLPAGTADGAPIIDK